MNLIAQAIVEVIEEIIMIKHLATIIIFISFIGSALNCAIYCADEFKELNAAKKMTKVISIDAHKSSTHINHFHSHFNEACLTTCNLILSSSSTRLKETITFSLKNYSQLNFRLKSFHSRIFRPPIS